VPTAPVSICPSFTVPAIEGATVFAGASAATFALAAELAEAEPAALLAVTLTRMVSPTSPAARVYVGPVAPTPFSQLPPLVLQSCHW
jgi:hypothetical protein